MQHYIQFYSLRAHNDNYYSELRNIILCFNVTFKLLFTSTDTPDCLHYLKSANQCYLRSIH